MRLRYLIFFVTIFALVPLAAYALSSTLAPNSFLVKGISFPGVRQAPIQTKIDQEGSLIEVSRSDVDESKPGQRENPTQPLQPEEDSAPATGLKLKSKYERNDGGLSNGSSHGGEMCLQVITPARSTTTGECKVFRNSCIPADYVKDDRCVGGSER